MRVLHISMILTSVLALSACISSDNESGQLSDEEIVGVLRTANQGEVDLGEIAGRQAQDEEVATYAQHMVEVHGQALTRISSLGAMGLDIDDTTLTASDLEADVVRERGALELADTGRDFDLRYICGQAKLHRRVLEIIDDDLRPAADAANVRAEINLTRPVVVEHRDSARRIAATLGGADYEEVCGGRGGL